MHPWIALAITIVLALLTCGVAIPVIARKSAKGLRKKAENANDLSEKANLVAEAERLGAVGGAGAFAVIVGKDGRLSTSKAVALLWTLVVTYAIVYLLLLWPPDWDAALKNLWPTYALLLGGPYATLVLSKGIVSSRAAAGTIAKAPAAESRLSDLVVDDSGKADLFDVQFLIFNLLAIWFALESFVRSPGDGLAAIPTGLTLLTAGPAAVYLSNKALASGGVTVTGVAPSHITEGERFVVFGTGFTDGWLTGIGTSSARGFVEVGGTQARTNLEGWANGTISAFAPTVDDTLFDKPLKVTVITPAGAQASLDGALTVLRQRAAIIEPLAPAQQGATVTAMITWPRFVTKGDGATLEVDGAAPTPITAPGPGKFPQAITLPNLPATTTTNQKVAVVVFLNGVASPEITVEVLP